jgi:branched-subunit amino acid ABC-type transport system permease component
MGVLVAHTGTRVLHLALGQVAMAGALVAAGVAESWPLWIAILAGLAVGGAVSALGERALVAPLARRVELAAILLIAGGVVLGELLRGVYSRSAYAFPSVGGELHPGGGIIRAADLVTIAAAVLVAIGGTWTLRRTGVGAAFRATAAAPDSAEMIGVDTARVRTAAFAVAGVLGSGAVLLAAGRLPIAATAGVPLALKGIAAAVAGRLLSPATVCAGALAIATVQVVGTYFLGSGGEVAADAAALALLVNGWRR